MLGVGLANRSPHDALDLGLLSARKKVCPILCVRREKALVHSG
jgi:hypothetical protein